MEISVQLPKFEGEKALIIVSGDRSARFYLGEEGRIRELDFFRVHPQNYPNKEGFFEQRGTGIFNRGHFDEAEPKLWREQEFLSHMRDAVKVILDHEKPTAIYLFAPETILNRIRKLVPFLQRKKIKLTIAENYINEHPFKVLERISIENNRLQAMKVPINPEARKILNKTDKAKKTGK